MVGRDRGEAEVSRKEERPPKTDWGRSWGARRVGGARGGRDSDELKRTDRGTMIRGAIGRGEAPRKSAAAVRWKIGGRSVMVGCFWW